MRGGDINLAGVSFKMDNENAQHQKTGIDYAHLDLRGAALHISNLLYSADSTTGLIHHLAVMEQSGVVVQEFKAAVKYSDQGVTLKNMYLQTPYTILRKNFEVHYPSLDVLQKHTDSLAIISDIENSVVGLSDVLLFAPMLKDQYVFQKNPKAQIRIDAKLNGKLNNLYISHLYALSINGTEIDCRGRVSSLLNVDKLSYNLNIAKLRSSRTAMHDFVPDSLLQSVRLPDKFSIAGNVAGDMKDYNTDLTLVSSDGNAYMKGFLYMSAGSGNEKYDMLVQVHQLNVGRILKQDSILGEISAAITAKGTGFDVKKMTTTINGAVGNAFAEHYAYHDILFNVNLSQGKGDLSMSSADSNLRMIASGNIDLSGKYAAVKADIQLDSIDFRALKLYSTELRASGAIHADFPVLNPDYPQGTFAWVKPIVDADGKRYYLDSVYIVSKPGGDSGQNITANLDVLNAHVTGKTPLTKIGAIIMERINRHYMMGIPDSCKAMTGYSNIQNINCAKPKDTTTLPADYQLSLTASIIDKPLLKGILPGLTSFENISINGSLTPHNLLFQAAIPELVYSDNTIEKATIKITGTDSAFTYQVNADKVANSIIDLWFADIHGNLDQGGVTTNISISDSIKQQRFALAANMLTVGDSQVIQLQPGLMLNYNNWTVTQPNRIVLAKSGFYISNFNISYAGQYIKANSEQPSVSAPLKVDITNFLLSNITSVANSGDTLLANGVLGAVFTMQAIQSVTQISGDLEVLGLSIMGDTLGDLKATASLKDAKTLTAKLSLTGQGNDINLEGDYFLATQNNNDFDMKLDIKALAVKSFETLAMKQIRNSSGFLRGSLHVTGTTSAPLFTGDLKTDNLRTNITMINSTFKMPAEKITFSGNTISFNNFTIIDSPANKAIVNGSINTTDLLNPGLNLNIKANKWRAIHSTEKDNKEFYGDLVLTTNLSIKGTVTSPVASGSLNILKGTNFTVVTPESQPEIESSKGIVVFVNMKDTGRRNILAPRKKVTPKPKQTTGSDVNVNITVDKDAKFSLIIDQASGDFISMQGEANINASIDKNGKIGLNGNYELHQGEYQLNYNFIKRKFLIMDGSNITFAGDPVKGTNVDLTAVYEASAPPYDLIQREVPDQAQLNYYKQNLPFDVDLVMKGHVLQPALTFNIDLPDNKVYPLTADQIELVQGKLSQVRADTSELNKQVFALLILGRFVSDDPFSSGVSNSATFTALQSASTFIGEQLNKAAGHFIKGVDISADLATTEDYTTGDMRQRTDLNLAASKKLMNDRLKLTIGNDFELEGQQASNQQTSYIPSNLAADYMLSADGKYTMRAYRRAYDEGVLQGYITETGINFIISVDYNHFKNILRRKKNSQDTVTSK